MSNTQVWATRLAVSPQWRTAAGVAALLAALALIAAFQQVVSGAVLQGEARRQATHSLADLNWRCSAASGRPATDECVLVAQAPRRR